MPSPFPGMDPFIEMQEWEDFHSTLNTVIRELLQPQLRPKYVVRIERRVYIDRPGDTNGGQHHRRADVAVLHSGGDKSSMPGAPAIAGLATPVECMLPMPEEREETYLVIREPESRQVITVLETLSPSNKRPGGDGRSEYLRKRQAVLESRTNLIELDLLRGGARLPMNTPLPPGDYYALVSRGGRRPICHVYAWTLRDPLRKIPVPLGPHDEDAQLDLQAAFEVVFEEADYGLTLDYGAELKPPPDPDTAEWLRKLLAKRSQT